MKRLTYGQRNARAARLDRAAYALKRRLGRVSYPVAKVVYIYLPSHLDTVVKQGSGT